MIVKSIRKIKEINNIIMSIRNLFNDPVILKNLEKINLTKEAMKNAVENTKNTIARIRSNRYSIRVQNGNSNF